jgi:hypothetical protein
VTTHRLLLVAVAGMLGAAVIQDGAVRAEDATQDAATLLFEEPQLATTHPGDVLTYSYSRQTTDDAKFGPSFSDHIRLAIDKGDSPDGRNVDVQLFSGANRRPAGPFEDMTGNPVLSLFLENHIDMLSTQFHANARYLKNVIRAGLRDKAKIEAGPVDIGGRSVPGWHVHVVPFADDPNRARMFGLDAMTYDFAVAKEIPGEIAEIRVTAPGVHGAAPLLDERVVYDAKVN